MTSIEEHHRGMAAAYDAPLNLPWLTLSPNRYGEVGRNFDMEIMSLVLASPMLLDEVL